MAKSKEAFEEYQSIRGKLEWIGEQISKEQLLAWMEEDGVV